jgi:hypothetical protein
MPHIPLPEDPSSYYTLIYAGFFKMVSFPEVSKPFMHLSSPPYVLHAQSISFSSILSPE